MTHMGTSVLESGRGPTRITIEQGGVEQTVVFKDFRIEIDRDYGQMISSPVDGGVHQIFYLTGTESWKIEGNGEQVKHERTTEPVLERYVRIHEFARRFMNELGHVLNVDDEAQLEEACKTISELTEMRDRLQGALDVLSGTKYAVSPESFYDEDDEADEDLEERLDGRV